MKLWRYINLLDDHKTVHIDKVYKEPFIWSVDSPGADYLEADANTTKSKAVMREVLLIDLRKSDGISAYKEALASMRLGRLKNNIPHETYRLNVYVPMNNVVNSINNGSWIDAYEFINTVTSNAYLTNQIITNFRKTIANYIVNSGNYPEQAGQPIDENGYIN